MTLEALKLTVARTQATPAGSDTPVNGTAFLLSRKLALTCAHCLGTRERSAAAAELHFSRWAEDDGSRQATLLQVDWDADVALLDLDNEAPVEPVPRSSRGANGNAWISFGHPSQVETDGIKFSGLVEDARSRLYEKEVMQLSCKEAADKMGGASGSPVMIDGRIVGMLTNQLLEYSSAHRDGTKAAFEAVYALPMDLVEALAPFRESVQWTGLSAQEVMVRDATLRAHEVTAKRIKADGKYQADRYVEREGMSAAFEQFMTQPERKCFLTVAKAGAGKTTAFSHLALNSSHGPALFFRGGVDSYSIDDVLELAKTALLNPGVESNGAARSWDELMAALEKSGSSLVLVIDAINETKFSEIPDRRKELQLLLEFAETRPIRVVVSCRDVFWTYFIDLRGQTNDFWWRHVYDGTYAERCRQAVERVRAALKEIEPKDQGLSIRRLVEKDAAALEQDAIRHVERRPSLLLGDFTTEELGVALGRYGVRTESDNLRSQLRHPLLLHLYSELATDNDGASDVTTLGALLGSYVDYKLAAVRKAVPSHDANAGQRLLDKLAAEMRRLRYGKASVAALDTLVAGNSDLQALRTYLLDEGILLEYKGDNLIGFQFDALFEYVLGRQIRSTLESTSASSEANARALLAEAEEFESLVGALEYCCAELQDKDPRACRQLLVAFARIAPFGKDVLLRIVGHLDDPLHEKLFPVLLSVLGDREATDELAVGAIVRMIERNPAIAAPFTSSIVGKAGDLAAERCAWAMSSSRLPRRQRMTIATALLTSPSLDAIETVLNTLERERQWNSRSGSLAVGDLQPIIAAARAGNMSFLALLHFTSEVLPGLVPVLPPGDAGAIIGSLLGREEFSVAFHGISLRPVIDAMIDTESEDVVALMEIARNKPETLLPLSGLLAQALAEKPQKTVWLISVLVRAALPRSDDQDLAWVLLSNTSVMVPGLVEKVAGSLPPHEAAQMLQRFETIAAGNRGRLSLALACAASTALAAVISLGVLPRVLGRAVDPPPEPMSLMLLGALAMHMAGVFLFETVISERILRWRPAQRLWVAAAAAVAACALYFYRGSSAVAVGSFAVAAAFVLLDRAPTLKTFKAAYNFSLLLLISAAQGVVTGTLVYGLGLHWTVAVSALAIPVAWRSLRFVHPAFYLVLMGGSLNAALTAAVLIALPILLGSHWTSSLSSLIAASILSNLVVTTAAVVYGELKGGSLRGTAGRWVTVLVPAATLIGVSVFAFFGLWVWVVTLIMLGVLFLLPVAGMARWAIQRVTIAVQGIIFGALAGLLLWCFWDRSDGLVALYSSAALCNLLGSFSMVQAIGVLVLQRQMARKLRASMSRP